SIGQDSAHIPGMARSSDNKGARSRRSPLTDFLDASEPLPPGGFEEAPQPPLSGTALSGSISDWARQITDEAEKPASKQAKKKVAERSSAPTRTARGTSMGGAASPRERAAAGLNPIAGLDIALEDVGTLTSSGVTAT